MKILLVAVGKLKKDMAYLQTGIDEYLKRLGPYAKLEIVEVADETITPTKTRDQVIDAEGHRLATWMDRASYTIVLSERGQSYSSEQFAAELDRRMISVGNTLNGGMPPTGSKPMIIIIGGALGVSQSVIQRADWVVSLSPMTFTHQMVRLIVLEQLYRAIKIQQNEPYHK